jgi:hypothetical protein
MGENCVISGEAPSKLTIVEFGPVVWVCQVSNAWELVVNVSGLGLILCGSAIWTTCMESESAGTQQVWGRSLDATAISSLSHTRGAVREFSTILMAG